MAENAHSIRTVFWGNSRFTYKFLLCYSATHLPFTASAGAQITQQNGNGQTPESGLTSESQSIATLAPYSRGIVVATTVLKFSKDWIMPTGKVKFYREDSGYGLIEPDDGGKDVFVHVTSVADPSVEIFREDRRVRYVERVSQRSGNPEAFDVVVL